MADRSVLNPLPSAKDLGKRHLEILESLKSAPLLFGLTADELKASLAEEESHLLAGTLKPESGKYRQGRLFSAGSSSAKATFRQLDANARILASLLPDVAPGLGSAQITAKMSSIDGDILASPAGVLTVSADIRAWSTNHKWDTP